MADDFTKTERIHWIEKRVQALLEANNATEARRRELATNLRASERIVDALSRRIDVDPRDILLLRDYVVAMGPVHTGNCPGDDTCNCRWKPTLDAIQRICECVDKALRLREGWN